MRNRMKKWMNFWLTAAAVSLLLTGCVKPSAGGEKTRLGMRALEENDTTAALTYFEEARADVEDPVLLWRGMGIAMMGQARYAEAVSAFETALDAADEKMPDTVRDIRLYQDSARYRMGQYDEVISSGLELLEEKKSPDVCFLIAASSLGKEDQASAREYFDQALSLAPGDYSLYLRIYECYEQHNLTAVGDEYLQTALGIVPKTSEDRYEIGRIYYYLEQYDKAKEVLQSPVEEGYEPALRLMGEVYLKLQDYTYANAMFHTLLEQNGESPAACNGMALCAIASGDYDTAIDWIERGLALEEEEGKQELRFNEIVAYEKKLDFSSALVKAESYCELYPSDERGKKELTFLRTR